jgi:hypothetical protein
MKTPPIPPNSKKITEDEEGRAYFLVVDITNSCLRRARIEGLLGGEYGPYWRFVIAAVAAEEWRAVMGKAIGDGACKNKMRLGGAAIDAIDAWREWGRENQKENDNENATA